MGDSLNEMSNLVFLKKKIRKEEDILKYFFLFFQVKQVLTFQANCLHGKIRYAECIFVKFS